MYRIFIIINLYIIVFLIIEPVTQVNTEQTGCHNVAEYWYSFYGTGKAEKEPLLYVLCVKIE